MSEKAKPSYRNYYLAIGCVAVLACLLLASTGGYLVWRYLNGGDGGEQVIPVEPGTISISEGGSPMDAEQTGLTVQLSEGQSQPQSQAAVPVATSVPLTDEEIAQIVSRLPELEAQPGEGVDFRLPDELIPPPLTGETISEQFPPPAVPPVQPGETEAGPLQVLRFSPEGEIPIAPFINVTFNQPMVPIGTLEALSLSQTPLRLEPDLPGTWRWLGTKTLNFQYDSTQIDRLPMATIYTVTIPAGTKSAVGGELAEAVTWTFRTPPVQVTSTYPYDVPQPLEPLFFIAFNQRIQPGAVLETIQVEAGGQAMDLKLATQEEVEKDSQVSQMAKNIPEGRWLAFKVAEPLPPDTPISVTIGPGTPSAEGPLLSETAYNYGFHTYAALRIVESGCPWMEGGCRPLQPLTIRFNNPLDPDAFQEGLLMIEPELPGASAVIYGDTLQINGATQGQTTYTVRIDAELQDIFGQKLGRDESVSIRVGKADPMLIGSGDIFITLDPAAAKPVYSIYSINYNKLELQIYRVQPSDWPEFQRYLRDYLRTDPPVEMPGTLVKDETLPVEAPSDAMTEVKIDLSQVMDGDYGHFIVVIAPPKALLGDNQEREWQTVRAWVQVTQIGIDAFYDQDDMVVWATALKDGTPLSGVTIEAGSGASQAITVEDGVARLPVPSGAAYLVASQGADKALLPKSTYYWGEDYWNTQPVTDELRWYVFDDRQMYRPGEEVHLKGWLRRIGGGPTGDVGLVGGEVSTVRYQVIDPVGNDLGGGTVEVNTLGGFDFIFKLPDNASLGYTQLNLTAEGSLSKLTGLQYYHSFQVQEFRRPEFEVSARNETTGPYFASGQAVVAVEAKYYAGGALANAEVTWNVSTSPSSYSPPNWPDFSFGIWQPWWWMYRPMYEGGIYVEYGPQYETFTGMTDASGNHYLQLDFSDLAEARPYSVLAEATVMDVNRQAWASTTSLLVHPASLYVGMRSERYFVERGQPLKIDLIVTDLDGKPVEDRPIEVRAARLEWKYQNGTWGEEEVDVQECQVGSKLEPVSCTFETSIGGSYAITALITDEQGRQNKSTITRWVSGGQIPPARRVEQEIVTLIPSQESYQPGEVAEILVQSPFSPAEGLLTVSRSGIVYTERFHIEDGSTTLQVPIKEEFIPNLQIQVDLVGTAQRSNDLGEVIPGVPPRPAYASGSLNLSIPPLQRTLTLEVTPAEKELEPGGETTLELVLKDANGEPVSGAELAVVVVDEAILALTEYALADPIGTFYSERPSDLSSVYGRTSIILADPLALAESVEEARSMVVTQEVEKLAEAGAMATAMPAAPMEAPAADQAVAPVEPIQVRMDFNPLALFAPQVRTDENGTASVTVKLPDNLTRYRVMVVAVDDGKQFGSAETNIVARLPLMARPSAPRFLNFGDSFELPVVLQNQTDEILVVDVVAQVSNLNLTGSAGLRVSVPARDRVEVRFPAETLQAGTARIQIAAVSGTYADAASLELPVYTPATSEAFATYGVIDEGTVIQPVAAPQGVFPQYGGLEINTSSTALQALTDAVLYLVAYPFECSEQLASRILAIAALRDVLAAFEAEGLPSPEEMEAAVVRDIERLSGIQNDDGGFPYWRRTYDSIPFNTIHVAYALQRAEQMGFSVPADMRQRALGYLQNIEDHYPEWYGERTRQTLSAYALFVRGQMGDSDPAKALRLLDQAGLEELSLEAVGWLWPVLLDYPQAADELEAISRHVHNLAVETAGAANFTTYYDDQTYLLLSSDRRTDAILLESLIIADPNDDLIPKVVNGLLAHRTKGRWGNTQENVFVLLALDRYFKTFEAQAPDFVARIWLGETYAGDHTYSGYSTERHETAIPMAYLVDEALGGGGTQDLILSKEGSGRLYYRLGLTYAPDDLQLEPMDMGFVVQRSYEAVDDPQDVTRDEDGTWHIRAGARVRVRLTMVADNRRYHVALVDPLPAGLEIVNPSLAVSGNTPQDPSSSDYRYGWWWWGTWYEHQNLRDERAEAFTSLLWDGVYEYTYIARATTPGTFVVPPAKAEEMYSPEVFGRSASDLVVVSP